MQLDDTFTFKKLVGGKYVTEKVKKRQIDDSFNFTVVKNNKKLKSQNKINLGSKDKNEIFFEFQVVKENKKENKIKNNRINLEENKIKNEFFNLFSKSLISLENTTFLLKILEFSLVIIMVKFYIFL
ncbi:hypothetical protein TUBRATIS_16750 [Tubulinosema ratisbonensis]|uniref:Uncharacterized protein n=1 Tax=Tubulinosema ratisbonensis TaxID=291195 RepID=A0A437AL24_9MICR|nr:hypothetical protein TUBRATIS_16750 [Tubulinosema ratisbonensis]